MARIYSPNEDYNRKGIGVEFTFGVGASTVATVISNLEAKGYSVDTGANVLSAFDKITKAQLVEIATAMGIDTTSKTKKQLVTAVELFVNIAIPPVVSVVASEDLTDLVLTFSEALYDGASAVADEADLKAKFTVGGVTITSAVYDATAKTITFVIADGTEADTITYTGNTLKDSAGALLANLSYTAGAAEWGETA